MSRWTSKQYAERVNPPMDAASVPVAGTSATEQGKGKPKREKAAGVVKNEPTGLRHIKLLLAASGIQFETEHVFAPKRRFRFDIAMPDKKIAIEYEGLVSNKARHTTITGYTNDCRKYNLAQSLGWKVYRFTVLNYREFDPELIL